MSARLFIIIVDDCMRETKARIGNCTRLRQTGVGWPVVVCLFADYSAAGRM